MDASEDRESPERAGYRRSAGSPRGEVRRRELLAAVTEDLAVNGLVDFSLRRAARAAGTTHKVLLYHFHEAGFTVLAFDYRRLGDSGGLPRQVVRIKEQVADWDAAIAFAATLPKVDPERIAAWGFSLSGGYVFQVAARNPSLAAAIAQTPNTDGPAAARNAARYQKPLAMLRLTGRAILDALGGMIGREPLLVPLDGKPGTVALLTTPDAIGGGDILNPGNRYPDWQQAVAARAVLRVGSYRPGRDAPRVPCPLLVVVCDQDQSALAEPAAHAASLAPKGELVRLPGGHYAPFTAAHERTVTAELAFLRRHLLRRSSVDGAEAVSQPGVRA